MTLFQMQQIISHFRETYRKTSRSLFPKKGCLFSHALAFLEDPIHPFHSCCPWPNDGSCPHCTVALHEQSTAVQWGHGGPPPVITGGWLRWTKRCRVSKKAPDLHSTKQEKRFKFKYGETKTHICVELSCHRNFPKIKDDALCVFSCLHPSCHNNSPKHPRVDSVPFLTTLQETNTHTHTRKLTSLLKKNVVGR